MTGLVVTTVQLSTKRSPVQAAIYLLRVEESITSISFILLEPYLLSILTVVSIIIFFSSGSLFGKFILRLNETKRLEEILGCIESYVFYD